MKLLEIKEEYKSFLRNRDNFLRNLTILYAIIAIIEISDVYKSNGSFIYAFIKWCFIYYPIFILVIMPITLLCQWALYEFLNRNK